MLRSCNHDLFHVAIEDREHPGPSALTDHFSGLSMEPAVWHPFLDAWLTDDVYTLSNLEVLDQGRHWDDTALAEILLEFIACLLSWAVMMCHDYSPPFAISSTSTTSRLVT